MLTEYLAHRMKRKSEKQRMYNRYAITDTPVHARILENCVEFKTLKDQNNFTRIGLTLAEKGEELVDPKCLEFIRKRFLKLVKSPEMRCEDLIGEFEKPLPRNLIAISISCPNFHVGNSCQNFVLESSLTTAEGFYTYQLHSDSLQYTYYNENGIEFQAGFCYYPAPTGTPKLLKENKKLMRYAGLGAISYPLQDRRKSYRRSWKYGGPRCYGRYCKAWRERVVVVLVNEKISSYQATRLVPKHLFLDLDWESDSFLECEDCLRDYHAYEFKDPKEAPKHQGTQVPTLLDVPLEPSSGPLTVLKVLGSAGITSIEKLKSLPEYTKIRMIHKTTGDPLPESKWPEIKNLLMSILLNPDWTLDPKFGIEAGPNSPSESDKFSTWLWDNPYYVIHCKTTFVTQLVMGNLAIKEQVGCEKCAEKLSDTSPLESESSESFLKKARDDEEGNLALKELVGCEKFSEDTSSLESYSSDSLLEKDDDNKERNLTLNESETCEKRADDTTSLGSNSSGSLLEDAEIVDDDEEANIDSELDAELVN